jgi:hypothetical protein
VGHTRCCVTGGNRRRLRAVPDRRTPRVDVGSGCLPGHSRRCPRAAHLGEYHGGDGHRSRLGPDCGCASVRLDPIQIDAVNRRIDRDTRRTIAQDGETIGEVAPQAPEWAVPILGKNSGYIQTVHPQLLLPLAAELGWPRPNDPMSFQVKKAPAIG